jgi:hypothetical protein
MRSMILAIVTAAAAVVAIGSSQINSNLLQMETGTHYEVQSYIGNISVRQTATLKRKVQKTLMSKKHPNDKRDRFASTSLNVAAHSAVRKAVISKALQRFATHRKLHGRLLLSLSRCQPAGTPAATDFVFRSPPHPILLSLWTPLLQQAGPARYLLIRCLACLSHRRTSVQKFPDPRRAELFRLSTSR